MSIYTLLQYIWLRRWAFVLTFVASVAAINAYAFLSTPIYRASTTLAPRHAETTEGVLQSLISQFGGVASLAGLNVGSMGENEALAWLRSRALAERFITQRDLLPVIFSAQWDEETGAWRSDVENPPTLDDAWELFNQKIRRISQDTRTRLVTVEVLWKDPTQAASWANELVAMANEELRARALTEADASIDALTRQLDRTELVGLRQSIYRLMEVHLNRKVLANSRPDYAFTVVDPAAIPDIDRFVSPRRSLLGLISIPAALFAASCVAVALQLISGVRSGFRLPV